MGNRFVYVALILWSQWVDNIPLLVYGVPGNLDPTRMGKIKLNGVKAIGSSSMIDEVPGVTSYGSPPCYSQETLRYNPFSSGLKRVWSEVSPPMSGSCVGHDEYLGLNVTFVERWPDLGNGDGHTCRRSLFQTSL